MLEIVETPQATKQLDELLDEASRSSLHFTLAARPDAGAVVPRGGGLRKIRWKLPGRGKRGGMRAIYFVVRDERVYILTAYAKSEKKDLTKDEIKELRALVKGL